MDCIEKIIQIRKDKIHYFELGKGPTILFLHGWAMTAKSALIYINKLSKDYRLIVPDLPGFGKSKVNSKIDTFKDYTKILKTFIDKLKLKQIIAIGHSFGALCCLGLATNKLIKQIIIIDSAGFNDKTNIWHYISGSIKTPIKFFDKGLWIGLLSNIKNLGTSRETLNNIILEPHYSRLLPQIKKPVLILWGSKDEYFNVKIAYKIHKKLKNSKLQIVKGTHDWIYLKKDLFYDIIKREI